MPLFPPPRSFPSLLSVLLIQGALTIALERQFFTLILRPVVMEIELSKTAPLSAPHMKHE